MGAEAQPSSLEELGWDDRWAAALADAGVAGAPARVAIVYQDRLAVVDGARTRWAELRGRLRRRLGDDPAHTPAVGDWVVIADNPGGGMATVEAILPRRTCLIRQAAGRRTAPQVVAANVDTIFVVTSPNRDFSPRRVERYLAAIADGGAAAAVLLNKIDLCEGELARWVAELEAVAGDAPVHPLSATSGAGLDALAPYLGRGRTLAFVGSSGVGKSSLINHLLGAERQAVAEIREEDDKGRHTTTHRELMAIDGGAGGLVIDTPGMRELQLWTDEPAIGGTFEDVEAIAAGCRFRDCKHRGEPGCAVVAAVAEGRLAAERHAAFLKLAAEQSAHQRQRAGSARIASRRRARLARADGDVEG
ncbi:MAG: ribosome small subunit-dependent GTPase A [Myxococcales bacterium]|nr:ribosome small subunit-dependent GTPase A [Myxococcales bacterium]